ncbi:GDP-mannose 4,6-dehydratase [Pseudomonas marginalis]|uniref:GDP-mannose 4,6-dehydratase n=1 Tax=Pseudomonas marginalis TaxID=298 RepID=UPI002A359DAD|nr:GDP-mannose 4,6-dehydratase [Pseudomonas marginalis]WPN25485.1 GDP-mannose 4,6-dehydratase [Pseudomonas marginalis]
MSNPYAMAKSSAFWLVDHYREAYNLFASIGILFNHESELPHPTPVCYAKRRNYGQAYCSRFGGERLTPGCLDIARDRGAASEHVDAMWRMLQCNETSNFRIDAGQAHTPEEFGAEAFTQLGLDWKEHFCQSQEFSNTDLLTSRMDPTTA